MNFKELTKSAKAEICEVIADDAVSVLQSELVLEVALRTIMAAVAKGESVKLRGFGTFERRQYEDRDIMNPGTGKRDTLAARYVVKFIPCEAFKTAVKGDLL